MPNSRSNDPYSVLKVLAKTNVLFLRYLTYKNLDFCELPVKGDYLKKIAYLKEGTFVFAKTFRTL